MAGVNSKPTREQTALQDAHDFILFCDGLEEAGLVDYARRGRCVARDVLWLVPAVLDERKLRRVMQEARDRAVGLLLARVAE